MEKNKRNIEEESTNESDMNMKTLYHDNEFDVIEMADILDPNATKKKNVLKIP